MTISLLSSRLWADGECAGKDGPHTLTEAAIAKELGWVPSNENRCGGYYLEPPFTYPDSLLKTDSIQISSDQLLFAQHGTSIGEGHVTITRSGEQIIADKAYLYRDPKTGKLDTIDLIEHVTLRQPNSIVIAHRGRFETKTQAKSLIDILYRTAIYSNNSNKPAPPTNAELQKERKITQLSAWGHAKEFRQDHPQIYVLKGASYSTCPPTSVAWQVRAKHIELNKETGRGVAKSASLYVRGIPIFYTPYLNFPIDARRQTGFLPPTVGTSSENGVYLRAPFYWNLAPNYDTILTPALLRKRGLQIADTFRYLTPSSHGIVNVAILPNDNAFTDFQESQQAEFQSSTNSFTQAELRRLQNASDTRKSFSWQDHTRFNDRWTGNVDYNYVSDDYYLQNNLSNNLNEVTQNQLLRQGEVNYQGPYWKFLGRLQGYQTLHPIDQTTVENQYTRLPQLALEGQTSNRGGLDYSIINELTHFDITNTPGSDTISPTGQRVHVQPSVTWPYDKSYFYFDPRVQFAMTHYQLAHNDPVNPNRALPIFDIHSGLYFDRDISVFQHGYRQTLEPQMYYVYVPYRNQNDIPIFDTTVTTLNYDELFTFNRFSGFDRIGDANQISLGLATRFIDQQSGLEKLRAGIGQIFYFEERRVTLCSDLTCPDNPTNPENNVNKSPVAAMLDYSLNPNWRLAGNSIWSVQNNQLDNQTVTLHYQPETQKIINLAYSFVRGGDLQPGESLDSSASNLSQTDVSFAWPLARDWSAIGRWTQNWNHSHFQNLLYGLQYDSCCWAVRFVAGRTFVNLNNNNTYKYNTQFLVQFALKGLGSVGTGDANQLLSNSISGYQTNFGQDF